MSALVGFSPRVKAYVAREMEYALAREALARTPPKILARVRRSLDHRAFGSGRLYDKGRDAFANALTAWTTHTQKGMLFDPTVNSTWIKQITNATNASPVVYTTAAVAHNFVVGDVVVTLGIGGNLNANQTGQVATTPLSTTFTLDTLEGLVVAGGGAYTSGGSVINLTQAQFVADVNAGAEGTDITIGGTASSRGVCTSSNFTWLGVAIGNPAYVMVYDASGGSAATNRLEVFLDGKIRVVVNTAAVATATSLFVEPLKGGIPNLAVLSFSDGHSATLSAPANLGDRVLTVTALAAGGVAIGAAADTPATGSGLPVTPNGGNITFTVGNLYAPGGGTTPGFTNAGIFEL